MAHTDLVKILITSNIVRVHGIHGTRDENIIYSFTWEKAKNLWKPLMHLEIWKFGERGILGCMIFKCPGLHLPLPK
jgi:CheY-specific phosphatase CheX